MTMSDSEFEDIEHDSDNELQEAFAKGLLKPGLNTVSTFVRKEHVNNVGELKRKLTEIKLPLSWIERLDLINGQAPLAPEFAFKLGEQERLRELELRNTTKKGKPVASLETDTVFNDFKREMMFHRQAQAAVLIGMPKLKELGVGTRRPDDYFAQMAKTDQHMHKVRENLQKKQFEEARSEKAKKQRQLRKMGKQIQVQTKLRRESEKKQLAEEVKKYRKGLRTDLDFLEDSKKQRPGVAGQNKLPAKNKTQAKRQYKDKKFGFGGKKRGLKTNTKESSADFADYRHPKKPMKGQQQRPGCDGVGLSCGQDQCQVAPHHVEDKQPGNFVV